jgi:hypothetical protein
MVGGGFWDSIKSGVSSLAKKGFQMGKEHLKKHGKEYLKHGMKLAAPHAKRLLHKYIAPHQEEEE